MVSIQLDPNDTGKLWTKVKVYDRNKHSGLFYQDFKLRLKKLCSIDHWKEKIFVTLK
jgi:hypothetical protein